ncbi:hypothetical protein HNY73_002902 [Argiope bruennichi]|uniref:Tf2-1-like SH3-like domain-containing protein n=1 Tax=Argiope bruennichi TaxID=94029 RepID=A0A8T0FZD8_ARGBR|nr:hypothetical protein HNY73_002902 [Argiope bruennichi]
MWEERDGQTLPSLVLHENKKTPLGDGRVMLKTNANGRKQDLIKLATEFGEEVEDDLKVIALRELILKTSIYKEYLDFVKDTQENIMTERLEREERERIADEKERIKRDRAYELEKLHLQVESQLLEQTSGLELLPAYHQATFNLKSKKNWVAHLLGLLPNNVAQFIAREPEAHNFDHIRSMLLQRFKLSAERMRQLFVTHKKKPESTWKDFHFKLRSYFEAWLTELNITKIEELKDLMILDQMKKRVLPKVKNHFIDLPPKSHETKAIYPKRNQYQSTRFEQRDDRQGLPWTPSQSRRDPSYKDRPPLSCYDCGAPGVVKAKCAKCNPMVQGDSTQPPTLNPMNFHSISMESQPSSLIEITICGSQATVCADTGTTHSVAGGKLYHFLKNNGRKFENITVDMALADGHVQKTNKLTMTVDIGVAGKVFPTKLIVLKNSKGNRTLLGTDFLRAADIKFLLVVPVASYPYQLRENEGAHLSDEQRTKFNSLLKRYEKCFQPRGEPTPFIEHRINTERKNRDLKPRLTILVGDDHGNWHSKLPMIRFALYTAVCVTTGHTPAFLQFGRELRTFDDVVRDFKAVVDNDNFVPEITPYLKRFANTMNELRERIEMKQDRRKIFYDKNRNQVFYSPGDKVWVTSHPISNKFKRKTSKFAPRRDGPYIILSQRSPTTYEIASPSDPLTSLGTYHTSAIRSYSQNMEADTPLHLIRKRGRPPKLESLSSRINRPPDNSNFVSLPRRRRSQRGRL